MPDTNSSRSGDETARAVAVVTADGTSVSTAARNPVIDAASVRAREHLRAEAAGVAADPADRAEAAQVLRDMEELRAG